MSKLPSAVSMAAMVGIVGSNWIAGANAAISHLTVPGILSASVPGAQLAKQWATIYNMGKVAMPIVAVISLSSFAYAAYGRSQRGQEWKRYATAGALTLAIVPFTFIFMAGTNQALMQVASGGAAAAVVNDDSVRALFTKWAGMNVVRSLLPLSGAVLGIWTLAQENSGSADDGSTRVGGKDVTKSHPASYSKTSGGDDVAKAHPASS